MVYPASDGMMGKSEVIGKLFLSHVMRFNQRFRPPPKGIIIHIDNIPKKFPGANKIPQKTLHGLTTDSLFPDPYSPVPF